MKGWLARHLFAIYVAAAVYGVVVLLAFAAWMVLDLG